MSNYLIRKYSDCYDNDPSRDIYKEPSNQDPSPDQNFQHDDDLYTIESMPQPKIEVKLPNCNGLSSC